MISCRLTDEPLAGTAPLARTWWLVEDPGPWGAGAPRTSRLEGVRDLTSYDARRVVLVRPTRPRATSGQGIVGWVVPGSGGRPVRHVAKDPQDLPHWPLTGDPRCIAETPSADIPRLLVCTNSARDACCGVVGRDLLRSLGPQRGLWESSHLGGHRFAPTALQAAQGMAYGRLTADVAAAALASPEPGMALVDYLRGSPSLTAQQQVAQIAVLRHTGQVGVAFVTTDRGVDVGLADGETLTVELRTIDLPERPASCGAEPTPARALEVVDLR